MRCEICGGLAAHAFSKTFDDLGLNDVHYWRCGDCGFVLSRTHAEMSTQAWTKLNRLCHERYQGSDANPVDPKWKRRIAAQADVLAAVANAGLLKSGGRWVDFGCGDGHLSDLVAQTTPTSLLKFDAYMAGDGYLSAAEMKPRSFDFVLTTSVFEHMTRRAQWDGVEALVAPSGALGIHTLVAEIVPNDPSWFYLEPPHCAFFSNAAMTRLFDDWGYRASVYSVEASLWIWFRSDPREVERKVDALNAVGETPILFREGFLDYWKADPRTRLA